MKLSTRYIILCLFTLSSAFGRAESVEHDFDAMWRKSPRELVLTNLYHTGTTDFCTYTCSEGAEFVLYDLGKNTSALTVSLNEAGKQVTTTQIHNLDSIRFMYYPANDALTSVIVYVTFLVTSGMVCAAAFAILKV